jgi:dipeptidyl-peptidase-4
MKLGTLLSVSLLVWTAGGAFGQTQELTNQAIWASRTFRAAGVYGFASMADGKHYTRTEQETPSGSALVKYAYATGKAVDTLASSRTVFGDVERYIDRFVFNEGETKLLIVTEEEPIYRHSSQAVHYVYTFKTKKSVPLSDQPGLQRLAKFSPDGNQVAFVRDNNLFIKDLRDNTEIRVTKDGVANSVINGAADWVYEEEFGTDDAYDWSPDGKYLAYLRFDETQVQEFSMDIYGSLYPEKYTFKYPKAGERNSMVYAQVFDIAQRRSMRAILPPYEYIPRIRWTRREGVLAVFTMNRSQNKFEMYLADAAKADVTGKIGGVLAFSEQSATYVELTDDVVFLPDGVSMLITSERSGYNHLWKCTFDRQCSPITTGDWDIIEVLGYDEKRAEIYFTASLKGATQKHVCRVASGGGEVTVLDDAPGTHAAEFSTGFAYRIHIHSSAETPPVYTLYNHENKKIRVLEDNAALRATLASYGLSKKEFFTWTGPGGEALNAWMIKPQGFDPAKKYPVYVAIYGGPGSNTVEDDWEGSTYLWHQLLAQEGYLVVSTDPRGTMFRGRAFKHATYRELGKLETEDFIGFAGHLASLPYVDGERIGIQGWSYGGFETLLCMTKGADAFRAGISVAPVTNWRYYDSIYTERFMGVPQENASGYDDNSPVTHASLLQGPLLLVHGSADDNVHFQNSMEMINALVDAGKDFDFFVYPDRNHGIYGGNTRLHLFDMMLEFVREHF